MDKGYQKIPRIMIAGTHSGVGKTTITTGVMAALTRAGQRVQPFKIGPDYIDPTYHTAATGSKSRNLDTWILGDETVYDIFVRAAGKADVAVIEGVMGVFDGSSGKVDTGSSAYIAKLLSCPVILLVDVQSMARSAAALVSGFLNFDPALKVAGVILNRVGSDRHLKIVREAIEECCGIPVIGWVRKNAKLELPSRHLGLIPTGEGGHLRDAAESLAIEMEEGLDITKLLMIARQAEAMPQGRTDPMPASSVGGKVKIGLAFDEAFSFYYPDSLEVMESLGAEFVPFSPLRQKQLPADISGLYIGGGFPEVFIRELAKNSEMMKEILAAGTSGMPVFAECGGYMYLAKAISDFDGQNYPMVGLVPAVCQMEKRLAGMGYVEARALTDNLLVTRGGSVKGHEFHYSSMTPVDKENFNYAYRLERNRYRETILDGYATDNILASYVHHHFASNPKNAERFVEKCFAYLEQTGRLDFIEQKK